MQSSVAATSPSVGIVLEGHLLDSMTLAKVLDRVQALGGQFRLQRLRVGLQRQDLSAATLILTAETDERLQCVVEGLSAYGIRRTAAHPMNERALADPRFPCRSQLQLTGDLLDSLLLARVMDEAAHHLDQLSARLDLTDLHVPEAKTAPSTVGLLLAASTPEQLSALETALMDALCTLPIQVSLNEDPERLAQLVPPLWARKDPVILMCSPEYFTVSYAINPWMSSGGTPNPDLAMRQWESLHKALTHQARATVVTMPPVPGLPDMVFTANAAFVYREKAVIARYKFPERQGEEPYVEQWFADHGFQVVAPPPEIVFEGAGDALLWKDPTHNPRIFAGYKTRTDIRSHNLLTAETGLPVLSLELGNPHFYHIDVCMCPFEDGHLLYAPDAFDDYGRAVIEANVPESLRIPVTMEEASRFACNAVVVGRTVIMNACSDRLQADLSKRGFKVVSLDLSEFIKAGGSAKCLTLRLNPNA